MLNINFGVCCGNCQKWSVRWG